MKVRLNLGCGNDIRKGWENYDKYPIDKRVKQLDLTKLPLPFPTGYADEIYMGGVYEHLFVDHFEFISEISRISKPKAKVTIVVRGFRNIFEHERCLFNPGYFNPVVHTYNLFDSVNCSYSLNNIGTIVDRLKKMLLRMLVREFRFVLRR